MMKGDKMAKRSSFGSIMRKRLSDITNALPQPKSPAFLEKPSSEDASSSTKDYIENLTKENLTLVKLIQDKNKLIELSGVELQKLRINLQKMQLQNWNLAQSNSQMVAELNFGKEKLKSLQHELSCKEALLKAKPMELKDGKVIIPADSKANEDGKPSASNRRQRFTRSRSMGSAMSQQVVPGKETTESKRRCLRRQSSSSSRMPPQQQQQQQETTSENLFEIDDMKLSPPDAETSDVHMHIDAAAAAVVPTTTTPASPATTRVTTAKDEKHDDYVSGTNSKRPERTSIGGRPLRKAAEKVQSYKEIPLKSKMRRKD